MYFNSLGELFIYYFSANNYKFFNWQHYGTEELAHLEMVGTIVHQLTEGVDAETIKKEGLGDYYTDHGVGLESIQIRI